MPSSENKFWHNQYTIPILVAFLIPSFVWGVTTIGESIVTGGQLTVSGTATSTIAGDVNFDSNTLYVDSVNNRVGVGTASPQGALDIGTGQILVPNGSGSQPALAASGNPDTGIYFGSNSIYMVINGSSLSYRFYLDQDQVQLPRTWKWSADVNTYFYNPNDQIQTVVGGSEILRLTPSSVGIATTTPWGQLSVEGQGSSPSLVVSDTDNNTDFIVTSDGKVGVGTASPNYALDVNGSISSQGGVLTTVGVNNRSISLSSPGGNTGIIGYSQYSNSRTNIRWLDNGGISIDEHPNTVLFSVNDISPDAIMEVSGKGDSDDLLMISSNDAGDGDLMIIKNSGNVGIGTTAPESRLQVTGGGLCVGSDANCNSDNNTEGAVYAATTAMTTYDLAENYPTKDHTLVAGDVVALDTTQDGPYVKRAESGDVIIGAISAEPGALLGGFNGQQYKHEKQVPVALSGRIDVKVSTENGNIKSGDYLELSSTPGIAARATGKGKVIGIALESYSGEGVGEVLVFVESHDTTELKNELVEQVELNVRQQSEIDELRTLVEQLQMYIYQSKE